MVIGVTESESPTGPLEGALDRQPARAPCGAASSRRRSSMAMERRVLTGDCPPGAAHAAGRGEGGAGRAYFFVGAGAPLWIQLRRAESSALVRLGLPSAACGMTPVWQVPPAEGLHPAFPAVPATLR